MSKNKQILIFSGIGLAVLGGVTAVLLLTAPQNDAAIGESDTDQVQETESYVLSAQTAEKIAKIDVANASGEYDIGPEAEKDEDGNTVYTVKGQLSWGHCLHILDENGNHIGTVQEKIFTFLPN